MGKRQGRCDTFAAIGPWHVRADVIPDPQALDMWHEAEGRRHQSGNTRTMILGVAEPVSYVSHIMSLQSGELVSTGTPPGVGLGQKPAPI